MERWMPLFRTELAEINRGKVGRPYSFCDSMIIWMLSLQTLINGTYMMAAGIAAAIMSAYGMLTPSYSRLYERLAELMDGILSDSEGIHVIKAGSNVLDRPRDVGIDSSELMILRQILESNRRYSAADTAYIYQKKRECKESKEKRDNAVLTTGQRVMTRLSHLIGGNGMRPSYTLGWLVGIALLFAAIMFSMGIDNPFVITGIPFVDSICLSISSLLLGGFFDINGVGATGYVICLIEGIIGLFLMLYFTVILTRKFIR